MYGINSYLEKLPLLSEYYLHNHRLTTITNTKYPDVTLDSTLSFNRHIDSTCKKVNSFLSFIQRILSKCHGNIEIDVYNYFVKPILNYTATVCSPHNEKYIAKKLLATNYTGNIGY